MNRCLSKKVRTYNCKLINLINKMDLKILSICNRRTFFKKIYEFKNYISILYPFLKNKNKKYRLARVFLKKKIPWPPLVLAAVFFKKKTASFGGRQLMLALTERLVFFTSQPSLTFFKN
jgi:hypothetical protein